MENITLADSEIYKSVHDLPVYIRNNIYTSMMVLEYLNDQQAGVIETGIDAHELARLAHSILQRGQENIDQSLKNQLNHLTGKGLNQ
jgi:hypothetical protein